MPRHQLTDPDPIEFPDLALHDPPVLSGAPNLLKQEFAAAAPNRVWLADITYIATGKGWLYFAAVLDSGLRRGRL